MSRATPRQPPAASEPRVRRGYFECRYGQLHVHNAIPPGGGFEEATPLICLPGAPGSGRAFGPLLGLIGRDRSAYAPDLPGCGESDAPPHAVPAADYAAAIGDFLDNMRLRVVDVFGQGAGAVLAAELAAARGEKVRRVVLLSVPVAGAGSHAGAAAAEDPLAGAVMQYPLRERLARLTQPVLLLRPRDACWESATTIRSALPAARVLDLPDLGADLLQAAPARVAEAVQGFLRA
jgi:pimeloyl-ACP methyl ester carboxylesterase